MNRPTRNEFIIGRCCDKPDVRVLTITSGTWEKNIIVNDHKGEPLNVSFFRKDEEQTEEISCLNCGWVYNKRQVTWDWSE